MSRTLLTYGSRSNWTRRAQGGASCWRPHFAPAAINQMEGTAERCIELIEPFADKGRVDFSPDR